VSEFDDLTAAVLANPTDRLPQLIFADWLDERGSPDNAFLIRSQGIFKRFIDGDGDGGGGGYGGYGGYGDGYGDGGYGGGYGGGGGGYGGGGGGYGGGGDSYGDSYGGDGDGGDGGKPSTQTIPDGLTMKNGLHIITIPAGYSPYVMVGWAERNDLFIEFRNCRVIRNFGSRAQLSVIAKKGPQFDTVLLEASEEESIPITSIGRSIPCDPKKWAKECPKPDAHREGGT